MLITRVPCMMHVKKKKVTYVFKSPNFPEGGVRLYIAPERGAYNFTITEFPIDIEEHVSIHIILFALLRVCLYCACIYCIVRVYIVRVYIFLHT